MVLISTFFKNSRERCRCGMMDGTNSKASAQRPQVRRYPEFYLPFVANLATTSCRGDFLVPLKLPAPEVPHAKTAPDCSLIVIRGLLSFAATRAIPCESFFFVFATAFFFTFLDVFSQLSCRPLPYYLKNSRERCRCGMAGGGNVQNVHDQSPTPADAALY